MISLCKNNHTCYYIHFTLSFFEESLYRYKLECRSKAHIALNYSQHPHRRQRRKKTPRSIRLKGFKAGRHVLTKWLDGFQEPKTRICLVVWISRTNTSTQRSESCCCSHRCLASPGDQTLDTEGCPWAMRKLTARQWNAECSCEHQWATSSLWGGLREFPVPHPCLTHTVHWWKQVLTLDASYWEVNWSQLQSRVCVIWRPTAEFYDYNAPF